MSWARAAFSRISICCYLQRSVQCQVRRGRSGCTHPKTFRTLPANLPALQARCCFVVADDTETLCSLVSVQMGPSREDEDDVCFEVLLVWWEALVGSRFDGAGMSIANDFQTNVGCHLAVTIKKRALSENQLRLTARFPIAKQLGKRRKRTSARSKELGVKDPEHTLYRPRFFSIQPSNSCSQAVAPSRSLK